MYLLHIGTVSPSSYLSSRSCSCTLDSVLEDETHEIEVELVEDGGWKIDGIR
jgi:hypothetical protein